MNHRQRRERECQKLFEGFHPDLSKSRKPTEVLQVLELARNGWYSHEIAQKLDMTPKKVQKIFRRYNFPDLHNFSQPLREERHGWKGGVKVVKGYSYKRTPGHPNASKYGSYVAVHRLVFEEHLGRFLRPDEVVHHIDGNPQNNNISNLELFENNGKHLKASLTGKPKNISPEGRERIRKAVKLYHQRKASLKKSTQKE